ncbi:MBL fold metallo-hydrolase [Massilia sp. S19_KUP03_FR1]|uniref:MBL fold metallo-hydrolase n=1 Tax=Massilia sp. S19_KUP03_FR1 TaxID=3025503 RepID=UPI002FCCE994
MTRPIRTVALAAVIAALFAAPAFAAAPFAKTQGQGFFRTMIGDIEVTAVSDGTVDLPVDTLLQDKKANTDATLAKSFLKSPLETSDNTYLINTGSKLVLVDTGAGVLFGPTLGKMLANLKASGYTPEQVDEIYITHMHPDHVGGLMTSGQRTFPNAVVRAARMESDYWLSESNMSKADASKKGMFQGAMASLNPYVQAGKYKAFEGDIELVPGVTAHADKGHTPGHTTYFVESGKQKLQLVGDLIHVAAVQMDNPTITISFDNDSRAAYASRKKQFDAAAKGGYLIAGAHLPFPGMGHLQVQGKGYRWIPVNYTRMP